MATPVYPPTATTNILVNTRINPKIVYLPAVSTVGSGKLYYIKDICGNAGVSSIYLSTTGVDSFDYQSRSSVQYGLMSTNFQSLLLASDGAFNWLVLQNYTANVILRFTPLAIPGLQIWLDSSDTTTFTLSGTSVTQWRDKSGNSRTASGGVSPTYASDGVLYSGAQYLAISNAVGLFVNTAFTIFIVEKLNAAASSTFLIGDDTVNNSGAANYSLHIGYRTTTNQTFAFYSNDLELLTISGTGATRLWAFNLPSVANRNTRLNGSVVATLGNSTKLQAMTNLVLGRVFAASYYNGRIYEVLGYTSDLSTLQIQQVEGYLAWKWGLVANLPANHPYKNGPP